MVSYFAEHMWTGGGGGGGGGGGQLITKSNGFEQNILLDFNSQQVDLKHILSISAHLVKIQVYWSFRFHMLDNFSFTANNFIARL